MKLIKSQGFSGVDAVSPGEVLMAQKAGYAN
jgi:hypothetical protein